MGRVVCLYFKLNLWTVWYTRGGWKQSAVEAVLTLLRRWERKHGDSCENTSAYLCAVYSSGLVYVPIWHDTRLEMITVIFRKSPWTITEKLPCFLQPFEVVSAAFDLFRLVRWSETLLCNSCGFFWPQKTWMLNQCRRRFMSAVFAFSSHRNRNS